MPDGDLIGKGIRFAWQSAYEGIQSLSSPTLVGVRISKAVTRTLRVAGGIPAFGAAVELVTRARAGELPPRVAYSIARNLAAPTSRLRMVMAQAVARSLAEPPRDVDVAHAVAKTIIEELVKVELLSKASLSLVEDGIANPDSADHYLARCSDAVLPDLERIADQLVRQPTGKHFRAPPHRRHRKTTKDLLKQSIV